MARSQNKYADFEELRERAVALRRKGLSRRQIRAWSAGITTSSTSGMV
ncbi:hypothetical protein [Streptomyces sp. NPDC057340]